MISPKSSGAIDLLDRGVFTISGNTQALVDYFGEIINEGMRNLLQAKFQLAKHDRCGSPNPMSIEPKPKRLDLHSAPVDNPCLWTQLQKLFKR